MCDRRDEVVPDHSRHQLVTLREALEHVLGIAAQDLVAPLAREHHLHGLRRFLRQHVDRDVRRLRDRRVAIPHELGQVLDDVVEAHDELMVLSAEVPCDDVGVLELAVAALAESHRERLHIGVVACHQRHDRRGVEATGEERAERHVAHHLHLHRIVQPAEEGLHNVLVRRRCLRSVAVRCEPVAPFGEPAVLPRRARSGRELADAFEQRLRPRHVAVREESQTAAGFTCGRGCGRWSSALISDAKKSRPRPHAGRAASREAIAAMKALARRIPDGEANMPRRRSHLLAPML